MGIDGSVLGLLTATFLASAVEMVEALTIVLALGISRGWRSTLVGAGAALLALAAVTAVVGVALVDSVPESLLQLIIGSLLLVFGLQWLRKAILRSAGLKDLHDEDEIFRSESEAARAAGSDRRAGLDWFAFVVSFKGVFLEGLEVVFIVVTFGLNAQSVGLAAAAAAAAAAFVLVTGALARRPLSRVPENTLKFAVGLLLASFGTFWAVEGLGTFSDRGESLEWPGGDLALLGLLALWIVTSWAAVLSLRAGATRPEAQCDG
jgi:Ca2+/H+ antiporter, TMEM165/GDT1 family